MKVLRSAVVLLALVAVGCGGINQTKFAPLYRAAKAVEASTTTGVTYGQFLPLVQAFTTELAIAHDQVGNDFERALVEDYTKAAMMYRDSATAWGSRGNTPPPILTTYGLTYRDDIPQAIWRQAAVWVQAGHARYTGKSS